MGGKGSGRHNGEKRGRVEDCWVALRVGDLKHSLAYASQCEHIERRAVRRANKARARLGYPAWQPCELVPVARPKGMWGRKFSALQTQVYEVDCRAMGAWLDRLGPLIERLEG